jgi:hypothetical protein
MPMLGETIAVGRVAASGDSVSPAHARSAAGRYRERYD